MPNPSQATLESWVREWQRVLRLQDWEVKVQLLRERNMHSAAEGLSCYQPKLRRAWIELRDPADHDSENFPADLEATLVHELIHLHFAPFYAKDENSAEQAAQEVAIELIALALMNLKRKGEAMAKTRTGDVSRRVTKGKPMPATGAKPAAMDKPVAGGGKMSKSKGRKKGC